MPVDQAKVRNILLSRMPAESFARLRDALELVPLPKRAVIYERNKPFTHGFFVETGCGSVITISPEGHKIESGLFGHDGLVPWGIALGADRSPNQVEQQVEGSGFRIDVDVLRSAIEEDAQMRNLFLRYAQATSIQTGYTALTNAVHPVDERLARWLLMVHDRMEGDELPLTHDYLSVMLAVRRPSVTTSLHVLEGNGFIRAERGMITVCNRGALEEFAGDSYGKPEDEFERLIAPLKRQDPRDSAYSRAAQRRA